MGDFNIRDSLWDSSYIHHSSISNNIFAIADSFNLSLSYPTDQVSTRYSDNANDSNSVIDLMFFCSNSSELNTYHIHPKWCLISDHAPLTITISITKEHIDICKRTITKNSEEDYMFIKEIIVLFTKLNILSISNIPDLKEVVSDFADII